MQRLAAVLMFAMVLGVLDMAECKARKPADTYFTLCSRKNPKVLNECVKKSLMDMRPVLNKGIPSLGLSPLDPMKIPRLDLQEGSGNFGLKIISTNFTLKGMGTYDIHHIDISLDKKIFKMMTNYSVQNFWTTSDYEMSGQILVIPIQGSGYAQFNATKVDCTITMKGNVVERDGEEWIELEDLNVVSAMKGKASFYFGNLFNGDKRLGDSTNEFLNVNDKAAYDAYKHLPEGAFSAFFRDYADRVFKAYPIKELFLD